jgi:hypothetical protein
MVNIPIYLSIELFSRLLKMKYGPYNNKYFKIHSCIICNTAGRFSFVALDIRLLFLS